MYTIHILKYFLIQYRLILNIFLAGSTIALQFLVSGFLTVILLLHSLSPKTIWTTVALTTMKQKQRMLKKEY